MDVELNYKTYPDIIKDVSEYFTTKSIICFKPEKNVVIRILF